MNMTSIIKLLMNLTLSTIDVMNYMKNLVKFTEKHSDIHFDTTEDDSIDFPYTEALERCNSKLLKIKTEILNERTKFT